MEFCLENLKEKQCHVSKGKTIPVQARTGPEDFRNLSAHISRQSAHEGGKFVSLTHWPPLPPRKYFWYSLMLEAESTPHPKRGQKDYVNEKFQRQSNPRTSCL